MRPLHENLRTEEHPLAAGTPGLQTAPLAEPAPAPRLDCQTQQFGFADARIGNELLLGNAIVPGIEPAVAVVENDIR